MKIIPFYILLLISLSSTAQNKIIAYATGPAETIKQYPIEKLTHIIYSFLKIKNDTLTFHNLDQENTVRQLVVLVVAEPADCIKGNESAVENHGICRRVERLFILQWPVCKW